MNRRNGTTSSTVRQAAEAQQTGDMSYSLDTEGFLCKNTPNNDLLGSLGMKGYIVCAACSRKVTMPIGSKKEFPSCPYCKHPNMAIRLGDRYFYMGKDRKPYTYATALDAIIDMNKEMKANTFDPEKWAKKGIEERLFENCAARWLKKKEKDRDSRKIAPSTYGNYKTYVDVHFPALNGKDVTEMKAGDLQDFYDGLAGSPKQKKNVMDALRNFFRWLLKREEITRIPDWPEMEPVIQKEVFTLSYQEQQDELQRMPDEHRDILEFLMETGLRPAEACALMKIDIKATDCKGLIRHNYSEAELTERTKQKKEYWIVFSDRAWELIKRNIANPTVFVFWNKKYKKGYRYKVLNRIWNKYTESGVDLYAATRHSFCTQLIEDGESLKTVQGAARHADPRTTLKYIHPSDERTRQALNRRGRKVIPFKDVGTT